MAELSVDIVVRFEDVQKQINQAVKSFDALEKEITQTGAAASRAGDQVIAATTAMDVSARKAGRGMSSLSQITFQAGQAISDFAVSGVLGAANNIEFLALQLGLSGPLIAGITAVTTALFLFGDDLVAAFKGTSEEIEALQGRVKDLGDELIKVRDGVKVTFEGTVDELEKEAARIGQIIKGLDDRRTQILASIGAEQFQQLGGVTTFIATSPRIKELQADLERVERVLARQRGLQESITASVEEQRELQTVINDLEGTFLDRVEKQETASKARTASERERLTLLDRTIETNERLKEQLEALRNIDTSRLGVLLLENKQLEAQIKIVQSLALERARLGGTLDAGVSAITPLGQTSEGAVTPLNDLIGSINRRGSGQNFLRPRLLTESVVEEIEEGSRRSQKALEDLAEKTIDLQGVMSSGLANAFSSLAESIGSGEGIFDGMRNAFGSFAVDIGKTLIGFGVAGLAIKKFVLNPATAIIAGGALVAIGTALKRDVSDKANSFTGGGSSGERPTPIADPRQGRDGRFRRDVESGFTPLAPFQLSFDSVPFEFRISGDDLVAVDNRTRNRHSRTRATSRVSGG